MQRPATLALLVLAIAGRADSVADFDSRLVLARGNTGGLECSAALQSTTAAPEPPPAPPGPAEPGCAERIGAVLAESGLPGAPELLRSKNDVQLYAKGEPVHFSERPRPPATLTQAARTYRAMLARTHSPWSLLQRLAPVFAANSELARAVVLSDGYLYAEEPKLAFALLDLISAQMLFNDKQIWIHRGDSVLRAERTLAGRYAYVDGPQQGQRVRLMLFDRVGRGEPPPPLHRDFRELRQRLGFDRARVLHETREQLVVELRYGSVWVRSLLRASGAHLELGCEESGNLTEQVHAFREAQRERWRLLEPLRRAMLAQVDEGLPFDEPRTEYGQQDGRLRPEWARAYREGRRYYEFNDDRYYVFDREGRAKVPQVCIDFIFDSFERAGGSWWHRRGEAPGRTPGKLRFSELTSLNLRRATSIVDLARERPELLDAYELPESERIPFKYGERLAAYLTRHADQYQVGDIVIIRGYAPWDKPWMPRVMHQHSFFVYETDPMTGMPIVLAGNPGQPVLQTWQFEAFRTPERSIQYRIRPSVAWLRSFVQTPAEVPRPALLTIDPQETRVPLDIPTPPGLAQTAEAASE